MVNTTGLVFLILLALVLAFSLAPGLRLYRRWRQARRRRLFEDVLKAVFANSSDSQSAAPATIAGSLGVPLHSLWPVIIEMERRSLLTSGHGEIRLTAEGRLWAVQIVRAHRLWETYLATEAGVALPRIHQIAERAEHHLSPEQLDKLDAFLGHPPTDPHGDPIPTAAGRISPSPGSSLASWPAGEQAEILHLEDEPVSVFREIDNLGLRPGMIVEVEETTPEAVTLREGDRSLTIPPLVAGNIQVRAARSSEPAVTGLIALADLPTGKEAVVERVGPEIQGLGRRRMLDLGLTAGARVGAWLDNSFGDPRAYRLRGTTIALRRDQARHILVRPIPAEAASIR